MEQKSESEVRLVQYLLGELPNEEMHKLEESCFLNDDLFEELQAAELELIDRYVEGDLSETQRYRFERYFLSTPARQEKLRFARAIKKYVPDRTRVLSQYILAPIRNAYSSIQTLATSPVGAAALAILITCIALGVWWEFLYQSPQDKVIAALSNAYREQRYVEARISGLNYAPLSHTRGGVQYGVDKKELGRAELSALNEVGENPTSLSHHALGRVYLAQQRFDEAISEFRAALEIGPADAQLHSDLGAALLEKDRSTDNSQKKTTEIAESQIHLNKALDIDGTYLEALFNRALWHEYVSLPRQAQEDWQRYLELDPSSEWAAEARRHLEELKEKSSPRTNSRLFDEFNHAYMAKNDEAAWNSFRQGHARTGNVINEKLIDDYLGLALEGKADEARGKLQMLSYAGKLERERVGDRLTMDLARFYATSNDRQRKILLRARHLMNAAYESYKQNEYEKGIELYSKARMEFQQAEDTCEAAIAECWIGNCYLRIPDAKHSLPIFERLHPAFAESQHKWLLGQALNGMSDALSSLREFSKSLEFAERSMAVFEGIQDPRGVLRNLQLYVAIHQQYGDYAKSLTFAFRAFDLAETFSTEPYEVWPFYHMEAFGFYSLGFATAAIEFQQEALRLAMESGSPALKSRSYARLALIRQELQDLNEAVRCSEQALAEAGNITGEKSKKNSIANSTLNLAHLYKEAGDFAKAVDCYDRAIQLHEQLGLRIYVFEAHRGKLLSVVGLKDYPAIGEEVRTAVSLLEQDRWKILEESNRNKFFDLAQDIYDIAIGYADSHSQFEYEAFKYSEASHARSLLDMLSADVQVIKGSGGLDLRHPSALQPLGLEEIKQRLPDKSQILHYAVLDDRIITWVIPKDKDVERSQQQISIDELNKRVQGFVNAIIRPSRGNYEEFVAEAKSLYDLLIGPVEPLLKTDYLTYIVPDKILNALPFGALISPSGRWFIQDHLFQFSPSSSSVIRCSEAAVKKEKIENESLLCVGNPSFDRSQFPGLPRLDSASREAIQIAALYNSRPPLIGERATEKQVRAEMPEANVIHFAGHYVVDERSPMLSKLLLSASPSGNAADEATDGLLQVFEIYRMKLPRARLVVLSACQTGIERYYSGEGAISIARPFITAGVPIVVASLWPVESDPTAKLMISFHKHRKNEGLSTVEALRNAQRDMIDSPDPVDRQPRFWAPFVVIGGYASY